MSLDPRQVPTTGIESGPSLPRRAPASDEGTRVSDQVLDEIRRLPARFPPGARSAVMPALDLVQEEIGYLTPAAMSQVAQALSVDPGYIESVATFYSLFHLQPIGKHHFYMCNNLTCQLRGAEELLDHLKQKTGVHEYGQVTADGLFSFEPVECLGSCEYAPVMRYDHRFHRELTAGKIDALMAMAAGGATQAGSDGGSDHQPRIRKRKSQPPEHVADQDG